MPDQNLTKFERDLNPKVVEYLKKVIPKLDMRLYEKHDFIYGIGSFGYDDYIEHAIIAYPRGYHNRFVGLIQVDVKPPYASYTIVNGNADPVYDIDDDSIDFLSIFEQSYIQSLTDNYRSLVIHYNDKDYVYVGNYYNKALLVEPETKETTYIDNWFISRSIVKGHNDLGYKFQETIPFDILGGLTFKQFVLAQSLIELYKVITVFEKLYDMDDDNDSEYNDS